MLKDLQGKFKEAILKGNDEAFVSEIQEGGKIGPKQRLHIYAHAYKARLLDVLAEDFPVLQSMVGDDRFKEICLAYIDAYPSQHPSLRFFGGKMVQFLKETKLYCDIIPAIEMADFEWAFNDVFDAPDFDAVTVDHVEMIKPDAWTTLRIKLQPSFKMHAFKWNTPSVWSTVNGDDDNPDVPTKYPAPLYCIQWKTDLKCFFRTVEDDEAAVLKIALEERTFPEICDVLYTQYGDSASQRAAELFRGWVLEGLVAGLDYAKF